MGEKSGGGGRAGRSGGGTRAGEALTGLDALGRPVRPEQDIDLFTGITQEYQNEDLEELLDSPDLVYEGENLLEDYPVQFGRVMDSLDAGWRDLEGEPYEALLSEAAYQVYDSVYGRTS